jgi:PKD repeat protein
MRKFTMFWLTRSRNHSRYGRFRRLVTAAFLMCSISGIQAQSNAVSFSSLDCTGTENGIINGSFETGDFSGWIVSDLADPYWPLSVVGSGVRTWPPFFTTVPTDGALVALTGFDGCPGGSAPGPTKNVSIPSPSENISLAQDVSITPCTALLMFDYRAAWDLIPFGSALDRHFRVEVQPVGGGTTLQSWTILTAQAGTNVNDTGNKAGSVDLSAYVNQDVRIVFAWDIPECYTGPGQFQLDNVRLSSPVIHATSGEGGSISPAGDIAVAVGFGQKFTFTPNEGYAVKNVTVDGSDLGYLSDFLFAGVVGDHTIHVTFFPLAPQSHPPVITSFTGTPQAGNTPLNVVFSATAEDPDGGDIIQYRWDFDGDGIFDAATTEGSISHRYVVPGNYPVTVMALDDQWESTVSDPFPVMASKPAVIEIPFPTVLDISKSFLSAKGESSTASNWVINPFGEAASVLLIATNTEGDILATLNQVLPAHGKQLLDLSGFAEVAYTRVKLQADHYVILATDMAVASSRMWTGLPTSLTSSLLIPHIAGTSGWQTLAFLSNGPRYDMNISIGGELNSLGNSYPSFINLDALLPENVMAEKAWGKAIVNTGNPFSDNQVLSGFQTFIQTGGDGAAMELPGTAAQTLYLPATNLDTTHGWKGLALTNPSPQSVTAIFSFYKMDGSLAGSNTLVIPAGEKLAGVFSQLFPDLDTDAKWAKVDADGPLAGLELIGDSSGGLAGLTLNRCPDTELTLPLIATNMMMSLSVTNPAETSANIMLSLTGSDGLVKATKQFLLSPGSVSVSEISDLFPGIELADTDYLMLKSSCGVLATETATNEAGSIWTGIVAVR